MDSDPVTWEEEERFQAHRENPNAQRASGSASAGLLRTSKEGQEWSRNRLEENIHAMAAKNSARRCSRPRCSIAGEILASTGSWHHRDVYYRAPRASNWGCQGQPCHGACGEDS